MWTREHLKCAKQFKCLYPEFKKHFFELIPQQTDSLITRCWVIVDNGHLAAYIALQASTLEFQNSDGTNDVMKMDDGDFQTCPAIRISLLAADVQAKGAGKRLVLWALNDIVENIAPRIGARFVRVEAFYDVTETAGKSTAKPYDSSGFYAKLGFRYSNPQQRLPPKESFRAMYLDLKRLELRKAKMFKKIATQEHSSTRSATLLRLSEADK
jgi:hypothetical protein